MSIFIAIGACLLPLLVIMGGNYIAGLIKEKLAAKEAEENKVIPDEELIKLMTRTVEIYHSVCPGCGHKNQKGLGKCEYCGHDLIERKLVRIDDEEEEESHENQKKQVKCFRYCPNCGARRTAKEHKCAYCGTDLIAGVRWVDIDMPDQLPQRESLWLKFWHLIRDFLIVFFF